LKARSRAKDPGRGAIVVKVQGAPVENLMPIELKAKTRQ
jgi:hypothetical protein